jgi:hypothetical protein
MIPDPSAGALECRGIFVVLFRLIGFSEFQRGGVRL